MSGMSERRWRGNEDGNDCIYFVSIVDLSEFLKE